MKLLLQPVLLACARRVAGRLHPSENPILIPPLWGAESSQLER